ncbi:MAG: hypothetical protein RI910_1425 [Verrucomicrobiota bacterium]
MGGLASFYAPGLPFQMASPYSLKIFLPEGDPDGVRTIEKSNWTGHGLVFPRALLSEAKKRKELKRTGIYVLVGQDEDSALPHVYIGEGDPVLGRLESHFVKKDFWTMCVSFTSKDESLNKAHIQYIESRLVELAGHAKRCVLENGNKPDQPSMSESDMADAETFLSEMLLCFPALGLGMFTRSAAKATTASNHLVMSAKGVKAQGQEMPNGFLVKAGSFAVIEDTPAIPERIRNLRQYLVKEGVLSPDGNAYVFKQDYLFGSWSAAASAVLARSASGPFNWKAKEEISKK